MRRQIVCDESGQENKHRWRFDESEICWRFSQFRGAILRIPDKGV